MKYTRNQINRAGEAIMTAKTKEEVDKAIEIVNEWRSNHLEPLHALGKEVIKILDDNKIKTMFTSQRLKRLTSIQYKLDLNESMKLGGMQDIGGFRVVLKDVETLKKALNIFSSMEINNFTREKINNYVESPKTSGYRSIHFVYKYSSTNSNYDGLKIELQIRTKLQHNWATAVETAGLYTKTSLKSNQGDSCWLKYFKIVSSLFAIKERLPVMTEHSGISMENLMVMCHKLDQQYKFCNILKALRVTVQTIEKNQLTQEYYLLNIDFQKMMVNVHYYPKDKEDEASEKYAELEKVIEDNKNAVVLVSVSDINELRNAYPSYFLDTEEFITALETVSENCRRLKLVE